MALIFGEENRLNPVPVITSDITMYCTLLSASSCDNSASPTQVITMPAEASKRGSMRSDKRPASGDSVAIIIG